MQNDKVQMQSPVVGKDGTREIREVDATPEALTPLMAAGWHQYHAPATPAEEGK